MRPIPAIVLSIATLAAAVPLTGDKRETGNPNDCELDNYPRLTEARVGDFIWQYRRTCLDMKEKRDDYPCATDEYQQAPGLQGKRIWCSGGTGVYVSVDKGQPEDWHQTYLELATNVRTKFQSCYDADADSHSDDTKDFRGAFQYWGNGYNILLTGSVNCDIDQPGTQT